MADGSNPIVPFLTFPGTAEAAMSFYVGLFPAAGIRDISRFGPDDRGEPGKILHGDFVLKGQSFMAMDIDAAYAPPVSWGISLYVDCADEAEFNRLFSGLSAGGQVIMGPEPIYELRKVAWITDRFGVTWQLVWA